MELVDQINNIAKDVWPKPVINQAIMWLLMPYLFTSPNPKRTVEKYLNNFKEITKRMRISNLFKSSNLY
jgi:hypothetical protein